MACSADAEGKERAVGENMLFLASLRSLLKELSFSLGRENVQ
jgi:hypothetical protein